MPTIPVSIPSGKLEQVFAVAFAPVVALSELIKNSSDSSIPESGSIKVYIEEDEQRVRIVDKGHGFSAQDILQLGSITSSSKMSESNKRSRINEFYAGSKGQGLLTAFNLCKVLEIKTYSHDDNLSYYVKWEYGTAQIQYEETDEELCGTELILSDVSDDIFRMLGGYDEPQKLISSTILYYENNGNLPSIELYLNGKPLASETDQKIEDLYRQHKTKKSGASGYFIAKAKFSFRNNKLKISYQDNERGLFNFEEVPLDLSTEESLKEFAQEKGFSLYNQKEVLEEIVHSSDVELDPFDGVFYIWRSKKVKSLTYRHGVRVYINNYGLYNYLNDELDWLGLSQISQNRKATSYKLKNTYGYVHFKEFDENSSSLKISNDRNAFVGTPGSKKFEFLMRDVIVNIFSSIDIEMRGRKAGVVFEKKQKIPPLYVNQPFSFKELVKVSQHLTLRDINATCDSDFVYIDEISGEVTVKERGSYHISFTYGGNLVEQEFTVDVKIPEFELLRRPVKIVFGTSLNLKDLINKSSLKHLSIPEINIDSEDAVISGGQMLSPKNRPGNHRIVFKASKHGIDIAKDKNVTIETANSQEAEKLRKHFSTISKYPKINDIINGIAESYLSNPTFASIAIRPLVEISLKAFAYEFYSDAEIEKMKRAKENFNPEAKIDSLINKLRDGVLNVDARILNTHGEDLRSSRKKIVKAYKDIEPNDNIHALQSAATHRQVLSTMRVLSVLINFIIEAINSKPKAS